MTAANTQIVEAFEQLGMQPEEIATDQELDLTSVKAILMQFSSLYRKACAVKEDLSFTDEEEKMARQVISNIARGYVDDVDPRTQLKAAMYIRDDTKGRLDVVKAQVGLNLNVIMFNEQMKKAIAAKNRSKGIVDIQEVKPSTNLIGGDIKEFEKVITASS